MVQIYKTPFAAQGDKDAIPVPVQGDGAVSVTQGFGYDYEREYEDPAAKDIRREIMNGILHDLSEAIGEMQQFGFAAWQPVDGGWPVGANVNHGGGVWQSLANANTEEPGTGALWNPILFDNIGQANETTLGLIRLASIAQAQAMADDTRALTPKKLADSFAGANRSLATHGFQKLGDSVILQWGSFTANFNSTSVTSVDGITFPIAFPTATRAVIVQKYSGVGSGAGMSDAVVNQTRFSFGYRLATSGNSYTGVVFTYFALGY